MESSFLTTNIYNLSGATPYGVTLRAAGKEEQRHARKHGVNKKQKVGAVLALDGNLNK
jgi:hypothetical protein